MTYQLLRFYLDKNQSHGQNDKFLRAFLFKLKVCRPQEDLSFWKMTFNLQKSSIILFHELKSLRIIILDKSDLTDCELVKCQSEFLGETVKIYEQNLNFRERLIFIELTNDLDPGNILAYQLIQNKKMIEYLQWRPQIEIKEWVESCVKDLEIENWFGIELNNYLRKLKTLHKN